jgi:hypothetical protein
MVEAALEAYIEALPVERRESVRRVREVVRQHLPAGYEEGIEYGMIGWYVPLETFPDTYNGRPLGLAALANQKRYISLYLNSVYGDGDTEEWFKREYAKSGKRLDMGKSCLRFKSADDLPLELIGRTIARADLATFLKRYRAARGSSRRTRAAATRD